MIHIVDVQFIILVRIEEAGSQFHFQRQWVIIIHGDCVQLSVIKSWLEITIPLASEKKRGEAAGDFLLRIVPLDSTLLIILSRTLFLATTKGITLISWGCAQGINSTWTSYLHQGGRNGSLDFLNM